MAEIRIGTSGYQYKHWKGDFYPQKMAVSEWFDHYLKSFDTVEINNTFYKMAKAETFEDWRTAAPEGFCYAIKYSRYGTHMKKLKDPEDHLSYFLDRATHLQEKLGPVLVQLPPGWKRNVQRLEEFLKVAPENIDWAVEIRNPDWLCEEFYDVLKKHRCCLVFHDMIQDHPREVTTNWIYFRFHGQNYTGAYSDEQLSAIAEEIRGHEIAGINIYAYFNNDLGGHAIRNALTLKEKLGLQKV